MGRYSWADQVAYEYAIANEWEEIIQEASFERMSMCSTILLYMRDVLSIDMTPESFSFIRYIVRGD